MRATRASAFTEEDDDLERRCRLTPDRAERTTAGQSREVHPTSGQNAKTLVKYDDFRIEAEALEDSAFLLTIAWPGRDEAQAG